jgi:hypothetical protein
MGGGALAFTGDFTMHIVASQPRAVPVTKESYKKLVRQLGRKIYNIEPDGSVRFC